HEGDGCLEGHAGPDPLDDELLEVTAVDHRVRNVQILPACYLGPDQKRGLVAEAPIHDDPSVLDPGHVRPSVDDRDLTAQPGHRTDGVEVRQAGEAFERDVRPDVASQNRALRALPVYARTGSSRRHDVALQVRSRLAGKSGTQSAVHDEVGSGTTAGRCRTAL